MASLDNVDESVVVADEAVSADPASSVNSEGTEMTTMGKSHGQSNSAAHMTSGESPWDSEVDNNRASLVATGNSALQEPCVKFIAQDETNTDWTKSRLTYSLPLSSAITDLCSCISKEAGKLCSMVFSTVCTLCTRLAINNYTAFAVVILTVHVNLLIQQNVQYV